MSGRRPLTLPRATKISPKSPAGSTRRTAWWSCAGADAAGQPINCKSAARAFLGIGRVGATCHRYDWTEPGGYTCRGSVTCSSLYLILQTASFWRWPVHCRWWSGGDRFFPRNRDGARSSGEDHTRGQRAQRVGNARASPKDCSGRCDASRDRAVGRRWHEQLCDRFDGLDDEPRCGAPRKIDDEKITEVVTKTWRRCRPTHWSTRSMARQIF
jgi:hypothetical protein